MKGNKMNLWDQVIWIMPCLGMVIPLMSPAGIRLEPHREGKLYSILGLALLIKN